MDRHELHTAIDDAYAQFQPLTDGQIATYIPELGKANPELFGIALATSSGRLFEVGDTDHPFSLQSISKPLMFGMALEKFGLEMVYNSGSPRFRLVSTRAATAAAASRSAPTWPVDSVSTRSIA